MGISSNIDDNTLTINVSGRFDFSVHKDFRAAIDSMEDSNVTQITVDMSSTEYVDSSALGMLLMLKNSIASKDDISIKNAKPEVKKILEIANFGQLFSLA